MTRKTRGAPSVKAKRTNHFASKLENDVSSKLRKIKKKVKFSYRYEQDKLNYVSLHTYNPDFTITNYTGTVWFLEVKGFFSSADRSKMKKVKESNPDLIIRMLFKNDHKIGKKWRCSDWCKYNGFDYAFTDHGGPPEEWFHD